MHSHAKYGQNQYQYAPPPPRVKWTLDVGVPSELKEKSTNIHKKKQNEPDSSKAKGVNSTTTLIKKPRHKFGTPSPTSESSSDELSSIWGRVPAYTTHTKLFITRGKAAPQAQRSWQSLPMFTVPKEAPKQQKKQKVIRTSRADSDSATATSEPPNHEIIRKDDGVSVRTARKKETKSANQTPSASVLDEASNVAPPPSPTVSSPDKPQSPATPFLTAPTDKILPVVIHYNFEGDPTRLNKEFHSKYQPIGFSTYRVKSGIVCQTSAYKDYLNTFNAVVDLSRFNNSCLKSPASTLVDLTFQSRALRSFSLNQLRNLSL